MCGIIYTFRLDGHCSKKITMKRYKNQKDRGTQGYGFVTVDKDMFVKTWKRTQTEKEIEDELAKAEDSPHMLFHHRFPTSTPNIAEAAHPLVITNPKLKYLYFVVHNGVIANSEFLRSEHEKDGFAYTTIVDKIFRTKEADYPSTQVFNDSESFAIELAQNIEGLKKTIDARGSIAFVALQVEPDTLKLKKVFYGKNFGSPLKLVKNHNFIMLASEGEGELVESNILNSFDPVTQIFSSEKKDIGTTYTSYTTHVSYPQYEANHGIRSVYGEGLWDNKGNLIKNTQTPQIPLLGEPKTDYSAEALYCELLEKKSELEDYLKISIEYNQQNEVEEYTEKLVEVQAAINKIDRLMKENNKSIKEAVEIVLKEDIELEKAEFFQRITK